MLFSISQTHVIIKPKCCVTSVGAELLQSGKKTVLFSYAFQLQKHPKIAPTLYTNLNSAVCPHPDAKPMCWTLSFLSIRHLSRVSLWNRAPRPTLTVP